jgi:hypothetical protein
MITLPIERLNAFRENSYRIKPEMRLSTLQGAIDFVKERGFVFFWSIKGIDYPSLWTAVAGNRPVAAYHDDPGHLTWRWKDDSLGEKIWYYGKIIRKKATMIDLEVVPFFYALSENYGNPVEDVMIQYHEGRLTREAKAIFDTIHESGPIDTIAIRKATFMTTKESNSRFDRAITTLQSDFKILPIGISDAGGWRYAFIYDLVHRHYPELVVAAGNISEDAARDALVKLYFKSVGAASLRNVTKFFQWERRSTIKSIDRLVVSGELIRDVKHPEFTGDWFAIPEVLNSAYWDTIQQ